MDTENSCFEKEDREAKEENIVVFLVGGEGGGEKEENLFSPK